MEKTIQIRAAGIQDAGLIKDMARKTFMETYGEMNTPENMERYLQSQFSDEKILEELQSSHARFFLAYLDEVPVAFTKVRDDRQAKKLENTRALEIQRIYVDQRWHGKGIAQVLMSQMLKVAMRGRASQL